MKTIIKYNPALWAKATIFAGVFFFAYGGVFQLFFNTWTSRDDYSHGFLIPLISIYLVWVNREKLKKMQVSPSIGLGSVLMCLSGFTLVIGDVAGVVLIQQLSLVLMIPSVIVMLLGWKYFTSLLLPVCYLILMVPVFDYVLGPNIHEIFQILTASISSSTLKIMSIPVMQYGVYIELPKLTIKVAEECSGIRYLVSILAIAIPLAYLTQKKISERLLILCFAVLIAILANIARVTMIGLWAHIFRSNMLHGPGHIFQGLFVAIFGYVVLFLFVWAMSRRKKAGIVQINTGIS